MLLSPPRYLPPTSIPEKLVIIDDHTSKTVYLDSFYFEKTLDENLEPDSSFAFNLDIDTSGYNSFHFLALKINMLLVKDTTENRFRTIESMNFRDENGNALWSARVARSLFANVDALVVGGTYTAKDKAFSDFVEMTKDSDTLYLIPGIGAQGGTVQEFLASGIPAEKCMISSGRAVMFPNGASSTPADQADAAKKLRDEFNKVNE